MWKEIVLLAALSCSAQAKPVDLVPKKTAGKDLRDVNFRAIRKRSASLDARCFVDSTPISSSPFEKPGDCDHFYQCSNGYLYTMPCAEGTAYNPALQVCDHPENVTGCGKPAAVATTAVPTPPLWDNQCLDAAGHPISGDPFEKPNDCDNFYQCSNGYLYVMPCAPGTVFDPSIGVCNHPQNVPGCGGSAPTTTQATTTTKKPFDSLCLNADGQPISGDPFEKPGDCDNFYQCSNGYVHVMPCAPGTVFDPSIGVCNHPQNVPGCGGSAPTTTQATTTTKKPFDIVCLNANNYPISSAPFEKPGDCDNFYQCGAGYLYVMPCADGTSFNPNIGVCDHSYNVPGCGQVTEPKCQGSNGEPLSGKPFQKPGSCTEFYQCGAGILYTMNCADGTVFNPATEKCDWPHNVPGC